MSLDSTFENLAKQPTTELSRTYAAVESFAFDPQSIPSVCVVCCSTSDMPHDTIITVAKAMQSLAKVRMILLSETGEEKSEEMEVITVPRGTKISKLRLLANIESDLVCICDPDLMIEPNACREVLRVALAAASDGKEVVTFGVVEGHDNGTRLSRVIAMDKWLSHRILRRFLWWAHIGISLPGQFFIISRSLLGGLHEVDSYLDDLYLGLIARQRGAWVFRVPVVVGQEEARICWGSLLTQRIRWMKGLTALMWGFSGQPSAVVLLVVHYLVFYGFPILVGLEIWLLTITSPLAATSLFIGLAGVLAMLSRRTLLTACCYLAVFPCLLLTVSLLFWIPLNKSLLRRR